MNDDMLLARVDIYANGESLRSGQARLDVSLREGVPTEEFIGLLRNIATQLEDGTMRLPS